MSSLPMKNRLPICDEVMVSVVRQGEFENVIEPVATPVEEAVFKVAVKFATSLKKPSHRTTNC